MIYSTYAIYPNVRSFTCFIKVNIMFPWAFIYFFLLSNIEIQFILKHGSRWFKKARDAWHWKDPVDEDWHGFLTDICNPTHFHNLRMHAYIWLAGTWWHFNWRMLKWYDYFNLSIWNHSHGLSIACFSYWKFISFTLIAFQNFITLSEIHSYWSKLYKAETINTMSIHDLLISSHGLWSIQRVW